MTHPIPFDALNGRVGILGIVGSGKTYTAIGLAEQLLAAGRQVILIDPTGAYHGLRTAFPIPIFGGANGDVAIDVDSGEAVARLIIDSNLSCIVDVSLLLKESHGAARRFMAGFVAALKNAPPRARYIVMDEADEFMPENVGGGDTRLFGDLKWIVRRGRIDGWRMLMVTQRPQDIAKSVLTQCETMILHKLTAPQDRKAVQEWVKGNADADQAKAVLDTLAKLETGEAWIWSPRHDLLLRARMPANRSADTSKTPDADDEPVALARLAPADIEGLREALMGAGDKHEGSVCADAQVSIADTAELTRLRRERDDWAIERAECQRQVDALQNAFEEAEQRGRVQGITIGITRARIAIDALRVPEIAADIAAHKFPVQGGGGPQGDRGHTEGRQVMMSATPRATGPASAATTATAKAGGGNASPAALAIVDLLDRINPARVTWAQAAAMTGRKASGGNFNAARKWIRESGRIVEEGDLIRSAAEAPAGMSREEAIELWKSVLTNPAPRMIEALAQCQAPVTKGRLGELIGAQPHGGNFNNGLAQLRRNGLIKDTGGRMCLARPLPGEMA